ncbi:radical SAM protein [Candidatus Woesearchaeota archaeon]|nr:radical SAM protein [Candidatus Woesearchaeota archaeon]
MIASICIVTRNRLETFRKCLGAIKKHTKERYELLIADNGSTDGTVKYLNDNINSFDHVAFNRNIGYAKAINRLISRSRKELIIAIDDDFIIRTDNWINIIRKVSCSKNVGLIGVKCEERPLKKAVVNGMNIEVPGIDDCPPTIGGWCIAIPRRTFNELGYFNEGFTPYGIEDADYGLRNLLNKRESVYATDILAEHSCSINTKEKRDLVIESQLRMIDYLNSYVTGKQPLYLKQGENVMTRGFQIDLDNSVLLKQDSWSHVRQVLAGMKKFEPLFEGNAAIIKLGYGCNNNCKFCHEKGTGKNIDVRAAMHVIKTCKKKNIDEIIFSGGEPTIHKSFFNFVRFAHKLGLKPSVISNGRYFSIEKAAKHYAKYARKAYLSLSGNQEIHDSLTGVPRSFDQTLRGIRNLSKEGVYVCIRLIISNYNVKALSEIINLIKDVADKITFVNLEPKGDFDYSMIVPFEKSVHFITKSVEDTGLLYDIENIPFCAIRDYQALNKDHIKVKCIFRGGNNPWHLKNEGYHVYNENCKDCIYKNYECKGIFRSYPFKYSVKPIK